MEKGKKGPDPGEKNALLLEVSRACWKKGAGGEGGRSSRYKEEAQVLVCVHTLKSLSLWALHRARSLDSSRWIAPAGSRSLDRARSRSLSGGVDWVVGCGRSLWVVCEEALSGKVGSRRTEPKNSPYGHVLFLSFSGFLYVCSWRQFLK